MRHRPLEARKQQQNQRRDDAAKELTILFILEPVVPFIEVRQNSKP
jgi:hypothetical protein